MYWEYDRAYLQNWSTNEKISMSLIFRPLTPDTLIIFNDSLELAMIKK
jgi:hypothetical protein